MSKTFFSSLVRSPVVLSQEDVRNANGGSSGADLPQVAMLAPGGGCEGAQAMASGTLQVLVWRLPTAGLSLCYFVNSGSASREGLIRRGWANRGCCGSSFLVSHGGPEEVPQGEACPAWGAVPKGFSL